MHSGKNEPIFRFARKGTMYFIMRHPHDEIILSLTGVNYTLIHKLADTILGLGGIIYGGYPRDNVISDFYAENYYANGGSNNLFFDPNYLPETSGRMHIPKDIDVFIKGNSEKVKKIYKKLNNAGFETFVQRVIHPDGYEFPEYVNHDRVIVTMKNNDIVGVNLYIPIDILYTEVPIEPPFGLCDMTCNTLIKDVNGLRLSRFTGQPWDTASEEDISLTLNKIIEEIIMRKTTFSQPENYGLVYNRALKMGRRGWEIQGLKWFREIQHYPRYDNTKECAWCGIGFEKKENIIHLYCCQNSLHKECFQDFIRESEVPVRCGTETCGKNLGITDRF